MGMLNAKTTDIIHTLTHDCALDRFIKTKCYWIFNSMFLSVDP